VALPISPDRSTDTEDWAAAAHAAAEELNARLDREQTRSELARRVADAAQRLGATDLVAASSAGQRLIATATESPPTSEPGRTVVIEGHLATGTQILRATRMARDRGIQVVGAIAITADPVGADLVRRELAGTLIVLESSLG
jgi:uracil phosphoribosyltransferase